MIQSFADSLILLFPGWWGLPWPRIGYLLAQIVLASSQIAQ